MSIPSISIRIPFPAVPSLTRGRVDNTVIPSTSLIQEQAPTEPPVVPPIDPTRSRRARTKILTAEETEPRSRSVSPGRRSPIQKPPTFGPQSQDLYLVPELLLTTTHGTLAPPTTTYGPQSVLNPQLDQVKDLLKIYSNFKNQGITETLNISRLELVNYIEKLPIENSPNRKEVLECFETFASELQHNEYLGLHASDIRNAAKYVESVYVYLDIKYLLENKPVECTNWRKVKDTFKTEKNTKIGKHHIANAAQFEDLINSLVEKDGVVLQEAFALLVNFHVSSPDKIFNFFDCFFKQEREKQYPIFLEYLLKNIFNEKQVFVVLKLMQAIQNAAQKELGVELYERSFVGNFISQVEKEVIFRFYTESEGKLVLKTERLQDFLGVSAKRLKNIIRKVESGYILNPTNLTSGMEGSTNNLWYNLHTSYSSATNLTTKYTPEIRDGSIEDNAVQNSVLMTGFLYAAYRYGKWRKEKGRAPAKEISVVLGIENQLLNQILLKMQRDGKAISSETIRQVECLLEKSGGIDKELEKSPLFQNAPPQEQVSTEQQQIEFSPEMTAETIFNEFLKQDKINLDTITGCFEQVKQACMQFHCPVNATAEQRAQAEVNGEKQYRIILNTLVFERGKFRGTFYSHLMNKAQTPEEYDIINQNWPMLTENCQCTEARFAKDPVTHVNDLIKYVKADYSDTKDAADVVQEGVENYFTRMIQVESRNWLDREDAELCFHRLRLIITKNPNLTLAMQQNLFSRLSYYLELGVDGPFHLLFVKTKRIHVEVISNFVFNQGFAAKRHAQTIESVAYHSASNLGSVMSQAAIGAAGWCWAACLVPVMDFVNTLSFMGTKTQKNLRKSLKKELKLVSFRMKNVNNEQNNVIYDKIQALVEKIHNRKENGILKLSELTECLEALKVAGVLTSTLEDHHCKGRPLIWELLDKLSPSEQKEFLKNHYCNKAKVEEEIKDFFSKKMKDKLTSAEINEYWSQVSSYEKFEIYISSQLGQIHEVRDKALFTSFRIKSYLQNLEETLRKDSDEYKLCRIEFKKFIKSTKDVSSPMRIIRKRSNLDTFFRRILHRTLVAGSWGFVSNFLIASVGALGGHMLFGAAAAFLASNPIGWGILGATAAVLLIVCGARLMGYNLSDIWGYTENTKHNKFMKKILNDDLEITETEEKSWTQKVQLDTQKAIAFISTEGLTQIHRDNRLFFVLNQVESTIWNRESCLQRLQVINAVVNELKFNEPSQKAVILCNYLRKVESGEGQFRFLQQANTFGELRDLPRSFLGGAGAALGAVVSFILNCTTLGLSAVVTDVVIASSCVAAATLGDGISTHFNSGRYDKDGKNKIFRSQEWYSAMGMMQDSLVNHLRTHKNNLDLVRTLEAQRKKTGHGNFEQMKHASYWRWAKVVKFFDNRPELTGRIRYLEQKRDLEEQQKRDAAVMSLALF